MIIGIRIKERRKELGLSAEQLADAINVSPATVYRYESGDIEHMGIDKVSPIARFLHTNEAFLMGWIDDSSPYALRSASSSLTFTEDEEALIGKYRKLNDEGHREVHNNLDYLLDTKPELRKDTDRIKPTPNDITPAEAGIIKKSEGTA